MNNESCYRYTYTWKIKNDVPKTKGVTPLNVKAIPGTCGSKKRNQRLLERRFQGNSIYVTSFGRAAKASNLGQWMAIKKQHGLGAIKRSGNFGHMSTVQVYFKYLVKRLKITCITVRSINLVNNIRYINIFTWFLCEKLNWLFFSHRYIKA